MTINTMTALLRELAPAAQNRIFKMILAEATEAIATDGPRELWLNSFTDDQAIFAIKAVRAITEMALRDAKNLVDAVRNGSPQRVGIFETSVAAEKAAKEFKDIGATFSIRAAS